MWDLCTHSSPFLNPLQLGYWIYQNKGILSLTTQDSALLILQEQCSSLSQGNPQLLKYTNTQTVTHSIKLCTC